jgi:hypothetical protein
MESSSKVMILLIFGFLVDGPLIGYYLWQWFWNIDITKLDLLKSSDFQVKFWLGFAVLNVIVLVIVMRVL